MSTRSEMTEQEMRGMKAWERRVLRPTAAKAAVCELQTELQVAFRRFCEAVKSLPEERMNLALGEERMTGAELLAHLAMVMRWQAEKVREIETGEPAQDGAFDEFFAGTQGRSLTVLRADFDDAWHALDQVVSSCSGETAGTSVHLLFGEMNVREWIVSISAHFDYHRAQVETSGLLSA